MGSQWHENQLGIDRLALFVRQVEQELILKDVSVECGRASGASCSDSWPSWAPTKATCCPIRTQSSCSLPNKTGPGQAGVPLPMRSERRTSDTTAGSHVSVRYWPRMCAIRNIQAASGRRRLKVSLLAPFPSKLCGLRFLRNRTALSLCDTKGTCHGPASPGRSEQIRRFQW
jgi:hypothetical protein